MLLSSKEKLEKRNAKSDSHTLSVIDEFNGAEVRLNILHSKKCKSSS